MAINRTESKKPKMPSGPRKKHFNKWGSDKDSEEYLRGGPKNKRVAEQPVWEPIAVMPPETSLQPQISGQPAARERVATPPVAKVTKGITWKWKRVKPKAKVSRSNAKVTKPKAKPVIPDAENLVVLMRKHHPGIGIDQSYERIARGAQSPALDMVIELTKTGKIRPKGDYAQRQWAIYLAKLRGAGQQPASKGHPKQ